MPLKVRSFEPLMVGSTASVKFIGKRGGQAGLEIAPHLERVHWCKGAGGDAICKVPAVRVVVPV